MRNRFRLPLAIVVVVVAGMATIATSPAPGPSARDSLEFDVTLSAAQPVVARRVRISIDNGGDALSEATLLVSPGEESSADPAIWVSLVPEDPSEPHRPTGRYLNAYTEHQLTEVCEEGCARSYVIVTRLVDVDGPDNSTSIGVDLVAEYDGSGGATPQAATASLDLDPNPIPAAADTLVRATQSGVLEIGPAPVGVSANTVGEWTGELHLSAAALSGVSMPGYPLAGHLTVRGVTTETGEWPPLDLTLSVGGASAYGSLSADYALEPIEVDWLTGCTPGQDCNLPVTLRLEWFRAPDETPPGGDRSGRFEFDLIAELAYLDGAQPPAGTELTLENR